MRIIAKKALYEFGGRHADSEIALREWHRIVKRVEWTKPTDVTDLFPTASIIEGNRVVFRIKGNSYRLIVWIAYRHKTVYIKWLGTHAEYSQIDAKTIGM